MQRSFISSTIFAVLWTAGFGQGLRESKPLTIPPARILMAEFFEAPLISVRQGDPRPMVEVTVNEHGPYRFLIETGARLIGISPGLAASLHLLRAGGTDDLPEYHVDSIGVGKAVLQDFRAQSLPPGVGNVDGVLGLPFFENLLLTIDYPGQPVTLRDGRLYLQRPNGAQLELISSGVDAFSLREFPQAKVEFQRDQSGRVNAIRVLNQEGQWETVRRNGSERL